jgi:MFS family permease
MRRNDSTSAEDPAGCRDRSSDPATGPDQAGLLPEPAGSALTSARGREEPFVGGSREARRIALVLGVLFGLTATGSSAAAVVLPDLQAGLQLSSPATAWVLSAYALALAVTTAVYGRLADVMGVRKPLVVGVLLMAAGAGLSAAAQSLPMLLAGRLLQGAGGGSVPVLATALVSARFTGSARTTALGRIAGASAAVSALGPLLGGAVALLGGWRSAVALPLTGLLLLPIVARAAPARGIGGRVDIRGAVLVAGTAAGLVLLLQSVAAGPAIAGVGAALLLVGIPLTAWHVRREPDGFLPRSVVTRGAVLHASFAGASMPAAWFALLLAVPIALDARGWTSLQVGVALVPAAAVGLAAAQAAGRILVRFGSRATLAGSALLASAALLAAALAVEEGWPALLALTVAAVTVAFSIGQPAMVSAIGAAVPEAVRGIALGVASLVFLTGGSLGAAAVGGLADSQGLAVALVAVALLPLAAGAVSAVAARGPRPTRTDGR